MIMIKIKYDPNQDLKKIKSKVDSNFVIWITKPFDSNQMSELISNLNLGYVIRITSDRGEMFYINDSNHKSSWFESHLFKMIWIK